MLIGPRRFIRSPSFWHRPTCACASRLHGRRNLTPQRQRASMGLLVNTMRTEEKMNETQIREQLEGLRHMTVGQLKDKYREAFGETSRSGHKQFLFRRIAWRLQANACGGLSERARRRALEIANDSDLRIRAPKNFLKEELDASRTAETTID